MRLRTTALPVFFVTVKPNRGPRARRCRGQRLQDEARPGDFPAARHRTEIASPPEPIRPCRRPADPRSGAQLLAAAGPAGVDDLAAAGSSHSRAEPVPALADELARLISALHLGISGRIQGWGGLYGPGQIKSTRRAAMSGVAAAIRDRDGGRPWTAGVPSCRSHAVWRWIGAMRRDMPLLSVTIESQPSSARPSTIDRIASLDRGPCRTNAHRKSASLAGDPAESRLPSRPPARGCP